MRLIKFIFPSLVQNRTHILHLSKANLKSLSCFFFVQFMCFFSFQPERIDTNAPPFDAFPDAYYNVIPDALLINSNISTIRVQSDNDTVSPTLLTPLQHVSVVSQLHTIKKPCGQWETYWQAPTISYQGTDVVVTLNGGFPRNCQITQALNLLDRNRYIAQAIHQLWQELGGTWDGDVSDGITPPTAQLIVERASETLADTIRIVNKHSDNAMARTIFLTLGVENNNASQSESSAQRAESRIRSWLFKNQINSAGVFAKPRPRRFSKSKTPTRSEQK